MLTSEQQVKLINLWLADESVFLKTVSIVKEEYFAPEWRAAVSFVKKYHKQYNGIPSVDVVSSSTDTDLGKSIARQLKPDEVRFTIDQLESFCRQSALRKIIVEKSPTLVLEEQYDHLEKLIRDAISIKVDNDIGVTLFSGVEERVYDETNAKRYSLGYPALDRQMDGGVARQEMMLVLAISGGGKSVSVLNFALNLMREKDNGRYLNCLYISLELPESMIDKRSQMILAGKSSFDLQRHREQVAHAVAEKGKHSGEMIIKKLRLGATANDIRALIKEIEIQVGWVPDIIVLDYLDKLYPMEKVSTENIGMRDKFITEEFYDLLGEFNAIGLTASQLTKDAATAEVYNQAHQAGGAEKTRSSDWVAAIHLTDAMRAAGQIGFQFLKTRSSDGVGSMVNLGWDAKSLRILNTKDNGSSSKVQQQSSAPTVNDDLDGDHRPSPPATIDALLDML